MKIAEKEKIYPACVSKHDLNREKQIVLLMIPNGERWHYIAVKFTYIIERNNNDFHCLNCHHSLAVGNKRESYKKVSENKDICNDIILSQDTKY